MVLPLDMPDDYPWLPGSGKSTLGDLGELAARLGSIVTYDRRGSVYWLDDFENGLAPWLIGGAGTGWGVDIVNSPTFRGGFSCQLTGGSDSIKSAVVTKRLAPSLLSTYGLEATFSFDGNIERLTLIIQYNTGMMKTLCILKIDVVNQRIEYLNSGYSYTSIDDVRIPGTGKYLFSTTKLVIDMLNNKYVRVMFNQKEYDLSDIDAYTVTDTSIPRIEASVEIRSVSGNNGIAYIDSVIITVGDP